MSVVMLFLSYIVFLLFWTVLVSVPVLAVLMVLRRRLPPTAARALLALSFAAGMFYTLYRVEWFDVWRHGIPSVGFMVRAYGPYVLVAACVGWWGGGRLARAPTPAGRTR